MQQIYFVLDLWQLIELRTKKKKHSTLPQLICIKSFDKQLKLIAKLESMSCLGLNRVLE